jgi:YHS domain-containing protein
MISSRWFTLAISGAVLAGGLALRPALADDVGKQVTCPVMGSSFKVTKDTKYAMVNGEPVYFCCGGCPAAFAKDPERYLAKAGVANCPVMAENAVTPNKDLRALVNDNTYLYFCCGGCPAAFAAAPEKYLTTDLRDPVSGQTFKVAAGQPHMEYKGVHYFFASADTKSTFEKSPDKYARTTD